MKFRIGLLFILVFLLVGCSLVGSSQELVNEKYGYRVYKEKQYECSEALENVYEDDEYVYYFPCLESQFYVIKNQDDEIFDIYDLIEQELLTIEEIYDLFDGHLPRSPIEEYYG